MTQFLKKILLINLTKDWTCIHKIKELLCKKNSPIEKLANDMNRYLIKEYIQMSDKHTFSASLVMRELQSKNTM